MPSTAGGGGGGCGDTAPVWAENLTFSPSFLQLPWEAVTLVCGAGVGPGELSGHALPLGCGSCFPFGQPVTTFLFIFSYLTWESGLRQSHEALCYTHYGQSAGVGCCPRRGEE